MLSDREGGGNPQINYIKRNLDTPPLLKRYSSYVAVDEITEEVVLRINLLCVLRPWYLPMHSIKFHFESGYQRLISDKALKHV